MEALSERNAYLEVCASLLEDTVVGSELEGRGVVVLDAPFQPVLPPTGLQVPAAPDKVVGGSQTLGEDHLITWVFRDQVLCVTDLSTTLPMPPTSFRIRLPEAPLSRDAVRLFPAAREQGREGSKYHLVIVTRALQLYRLTLSLPATMLTEQDVTDAKNLYGVPYTSVLSGRVEAWAQVRVEQLPTGATVLTCASWSEHDMLVVGFNSGRVQKMNVLWDLNGVSVRLELPEPSSLDSGGLGLGWRFGAQRQPQQQHSQQALSAQEYSFAGQSILLTLHADSKVRTWNSTKPIQTMELPGARIRIGPGDTATWHKVALLPSYAKGVARDVDGWYMVALMASANFSQLWLSHRMYEQSELWLPTPVVWHDPYNCLDLIRDVSLSSCVPSTPAAIMGSPSRRPARGEPMVLWMVKALGVEGIEVAKDHVNIDEKQAQLRRVWRPPTVLGGSAAGLLPRNPHQLSEALRHMEESAQGGSWWDERMAEHEGVFARMLVQRQEGLGGYSRALLERAVDRWLQVGAPAAEPAPADPEARALWLAKLVRAAVQRDYAPEPYDPSLHGREMLERLVLQWWNLIGLVERGHEQDSTPLALLVPPPPSNEQQPQPSLIVRADRVCALVSARPLLIMAQGQAPAAGTAMASPSKLRWFGFGGNRMDDEDEGMSQKVSIQRTEAAVASVNSWMHNCCAGLMPELLRCINDGLHYQGGRLPSHTRIKRIVEHFLATAKEMPPELTLSMGNVETYLKHLELLPTLPHQPPAGEAGWMTPLSAVLCARSMVPLLHGHVLPRVLVLLVALLLLEEEGMMPLRATTANQVEEDAKLRSCVVWSSVLLHRVVALCHLSTHPMLQNQKTHSSLTAQSAMLAPSAAVPPPPFSHPLLSVFLLHLQAALEPQPTCPPHIKKLTLPCSPLPPRDDQTPTASEAPLSSALVLLYKVLIYKPVLLLRFLEGEQQYRHLFVLVQTLMKDELDGVEGLTPAEKRDLKRILARCYINEARRVVDEDPQGAEGLFDLAEKTLLAYDDCTLALDDGDEERRRRAGEMDFQDDENDMQVDTGVEEHKGPAGDTSTAKVTRAGRRAQHFLKAVAMFQPSVGLCGCPPRRLIRLAAAGLRGLPSGRAAYGQAGDAPALSQAELLWGIIFTAAMEENRFDEALAAIRAEYDLWQDVDPDKADAARSTKLSLLVVELCERGRFDKVCGLPWSKGDGRDEMDVVEGVLRAYARFVFIEGESTYESAIVTAGMQQRQYSRGEWDALNHKQRRRSRGSDGGRRLLEDRMDDGNVDRTESAPVDYYQALFAFLVRVRNYRGAATEMYRLCKRLDAGTAFEDDMLRLNKKIEALAQVCNCLELLPGDQQLLLWATEELLPQEDAIDGTGAGAFSGSQKRVKVVTIGDVRHELAFAIASREYLQKAGSQAAPLRPLNLTPPAAVKTQGNKPGGNMSVAAQVGHAAYMLTQVGLHESAASLLTAFDMPLSTVIRSLAAAVVDLGLPQSGSMSPPSFVLEALPVHAHSFTLAAGHDPSLPGPHLQARQAEALLRDMLEREGRGSYYVEAACVMVYKDSYFLPDWLLDAFTTPSGAVEQRGDKPSANQAPDAGAFLQVHAKKAWFLVRGARAAVQARVTGSLGGEPDPAATEIVIAPSAHSRVEAMHLLVRAMQAAMIMVAKASEAVAGAVSAGSMMQEGGAKGARQLWVPLSHMDVLLQLASEIAPHGANWQREEEREGAAALHGASEALMDSLKGYYTDVAVAEAVLPDIQ